MAALLGITNDNPLHPKIAAVGVSGAAVTVIVAVLKRLLKIDVPPEVVAGGAGVILFVIGIIKKPHPAAV